MNTYVAHAVAIPEQGTSLPPDGVSLNVPSDVRAAALPAGFPFLLDANSGVIVEPVLLWMLSEHLGGRHRAWVRNTAQGQADALKNFFDYLESAEVGWDEVDEVEIANYRDAMQSLISRKTHQLLSDRTVQVRLTHVLAFYDWSLKAGIFPGTAFSKRKVRRRRPIDDDMLSHVRGGSPLAERSAVLPDAKGRAGDEVRPFGRANLQNVLRAFGPLPSNCKSERLVIDPRPSRDRLAAELGVVVGLRVDEIRSLRAHQILELCPSDWRDHDLGPAVILHLTKTKGLVRRSVPLPTWLLYELDLYIRGERADAIKKAATLKKVGRRRPASNLFVNSALAGANTGKTPF